MRKRRRQQLPTEPQQATIESLSHEGRGITHIDGKTTFIEGALPGEEVSFLLTLIKGQYNEGRVVEVLKPSPDRITPPCIHADICGGCSMQHFNADKQIEFKQDVLASHFKHFGNIQPKAWLEPLTGPTLNYRRKARLGVKYVYKKQKVLVGFREKQSRYLADIQSCKILIPEIGDRLETFQQLIASLDSFEKIPQIEIAQGDDHTALVFRHLVELSDKDQQSLIQFGIDHQFHIYLQPKGPTTVHRIYPEPNGDLLSLQLDQDLQLKFHPLDFIQVNREINIKMLQLALDLLDPKQEDIILDLFCGLGNFTLPLAKRCKQVIGVEGDDAMVKGARSNAAFNQINNCEFFSADLFKPLNEEPWAKQQFNKILIDPPRAGALEIVQQISQFNADTILYVSCNPATLARDAGELIKQGYTLEKAGVMDMFPHTSHVESIALFFK